MGIALVAVIALSAMPTAAGAFVGEGVVLNPGKTDLTGPAKTILTNPTFLPETASEAAAFGGAEEASVATGLFESAGLLPALGAVVSFGVGAGVGSYICNSVLQLEGCWFFGSEAADGEPPKSFEWILVRSAETTPLGGVIRPYTYVLGSGGSAQEFNYTETKCPTGSLPNGTTWVVKYAFHEKACFISGVFYPSTGYFFVHDPLANRLFAGATKAEASGGTKYTGSGYCPVAAPTTCGKTSPSNWSERLASCLNSPSPCGATSAARDRVGQKLASKVEGSKVANPYANIEIPDCGAYLWGKCAEELEKLGLKPSRSELGWETAVIAKPADAVVETKPAAGGLVLKGSTVTVVTNPGEADMPLVVPLPESGETYSHYAARLNPGLVGERHDLDAAFIDPSVGPNGVVEVSPEPATRLDPSMEHTVKVTTNPADAPVPAAGWVPPTVPAVDMGPLSGIPSPCSVFPFGLLCWVGEAFAQFNTTGVCPNVAVPVAKTTFDITLCGETTETIMGYLRPAMLLVFIVGCGFLFARATKAVGGD